MPTKPKTFTVLNPRGIQNGIRILRYYDQEWFEGDDFVKPPRMTEAQLEAWAGFLKEKVNG